MAKKKSKKKSRKKSKPNSSFLLKLIIVVGIGFGAFKGYNYYFNDVNKIKQSLTKLSELKTIEYSYQELIYAQDSVLFGISTSEYARKYKGSIKAGIEMDKIEVNIDGNKTVTIVLPKPIITDNSIDPNSKKVLLDQAGLLSSVDNNTVENKIEELMKEKEKNIKDDLFNQALDNAELLIGGVVKAINPTLTLEFKRRS